MKYTPEELYIYAEENGLLPLLRIALASNKSGFIVLPIDPVIELDGERLILKSADEEQAPVNDMDICIGTTADENAMEKYRIWKKRKEDINALLLICKEGLSYIISAKKNKDDDIEKENMRLAAITFMKYQGIDTHGKLKAACEYARQKLLEQTTAFSDLLNGQPGRF